MFEAKDMQLATFASAWSFGTLERCYQQVASGAFDGVEGRCPARREERARVRQASERDWVPFIAEICTGGDYAPPSNVSAEAHLEDFRLQLEHALECGASQVTCLLGSDSWELSEAVDCFGRALELSNETKLPISFETHRGRPTFHPNATERLLKALPDLRLTCDLSHWCVVCERLLDQPAVLDAVAPRTSHIHARVGYAQGPQVPDPRVPAYRNELRAHERWWTTMWRAAASGGAKRFTVTPEFGPDGYLHTDPHTQVPVANLEELNTWMSARVRRIFAELPEAE